MAIGIERMERGQLFRERWLPILAYAALIFALSSVPGLHLPGKQDIGDKLAHVLEYGGLGWLLHRATRDTWPGVPGLQRAMLGILAVSMLGACDEVFQAGVRGRESSVLDWLADTVGVSLAHLIGLAREKRSGGA